MGRKRGVILENRRERGRSVNGEKGREIYREGGV